MKQCGLNAAYAAAPLAAPFFTPGHWSPEALQMAYWPIGRINPGITRCQMDLALWEQGTILQAQALWGQSPTTDSTPRREAITATEDVD